jgi:hypothetical protein
LVRYCISTRFGVEDSQERGRQVRHALGCRLRRRRHRHLRAKPEEQVAFVIEVKALGEDWPEDWELLRVDEATVRRHSTLSAQWCLVDEGPEVPTGDDHTKRHGYGAVAPLTGRTHDHLSSELGKAEFAPCLPHLLA